MDGTFIHGSWFDVGAILKDMSTTERQRAYACDITYGTNKRVWL